MIGNEPGCFFRLPVGLGRGLRSSFRLELSADVCVSDGGWVAWVSEMESSNSAVPISGVGVSTMVGSSAAVPVRADSARGEEGMGKELGFMRLKMRVLVFVAWAWRVESGRVARQRNSEA